MDTCNEILPTPLGCMEGVDTNETMEILGMNSDARNITDNTVKPKEIYKARRCKGAASEIHLKTVREKIHSSIQEIAQVSSFNFYLSGPDYILKKILVLVYTLS